MDSSPEDDSLDQLGIEEEEDSPDQQYSQPSEDSEALPQPGLIEICCVGAGRLGVISMLVMAKHCQNVNITIVDRLDEKINMWKEPGALKFPIYEPGLQQLYEEVMPTNRLSFSTDLNICLDRARIIFIAVGITSMSKPEKKKGCLEVDDWDNVCRILKEVDAIEDKIIVTLSTVPLNFKSLIREIFYDFGQLKFLLNPSFLREGTAILDTENPPQVLIAYDPYPNQLMGDPNPNQLMDDLGVNLLRDLYLQWVDEECINVVIGFASATMGKLTINGFLGTQISYMNAITLACNSEESDEDANVDVVYSILSRYRNQGNHENHYLFNPKSSIGFGGGLVKDISYLSFVAKSRNLPGATDFFKSILKVNEGIRKTFVKTMRLKMNSLRGKKFAIFGFTYKGETENINNSPAIGICQELLREEGADEIKIYDPQAKETDIHLCFHKTERYRVKKRPSGIDACYQVDAVLVLTDWPQFLTLNYTNIYANMSKASSHDIFIGRDMEGLPNLANIGFRVHHIKTMKHCSI